MRERRGDADGIFQRGRRQLKFGAPAKEHDFHRDCFMLDLFFEMRAALRIEIQPHFGLRILLEFLDHQLIAADAGFPVDAFHRVAVDVLAHARRVRRNVRRFFANDLPAG